MALSVISCRDGESPATAPMSAAPSIQMAVVDPHSGDWNRLDADVDVIVESGGSPLLSKRKASRGLTYHFTRRRDASGQWVSDLGFEELMPRTSSGLARGGPPHPKRVKGTSANEAGTLLDASGRPINVQIPSQTETAINAPTRIARGPRTPRQMPNTGPPAGSRIADTSRAWARIYFPTPAGADLAIDTVTDAVESLPGERRRYRRQRGGLVTEVTVNRVTGAVEETRVLEHGRVRTASSRQYELDQNGVLTLKSERKLHYPRGRDDPGVITLTYRNIRLSKEQ